MKSEASDIRQLDSLGRVVIPKKMRTALGIGENDNLRITLEANTIVIKREAPMCVVCKREKELNQIGATYICTSCAKQIADMV